MANTCLLGVRAHGNLLHIFSVLNVEILSAKLETISSLLSLESSTSASVVRKSGPIWGHSRRLQREGCQDPGLGKGIWHPFCQDDNFPKNRVQSVGWKKPTEKRLSLNIDQVYGTQRNTFLFSRKLFPKAFLIAVFLKSQHVGWGILEGDVHTP